MNNILDLFTIKSSKPAFIGEDIVLSFNDLSNISKSIGTYIINIGLKNKPVVIRMKSGPNMIAAFLGVLYAGCFYVPMDIEAPNERKMAIIGTVNPSLIITDELYAIISKTMINEDFLHKRRKTCIDTDPAYVVFTSGTTGKPKGIVASHRNVLDYIENLSNILHFDENTIFGNQAPLHLDACLKEIIPTIKYGASTYFIPRNLFMFPVKLLEYIVEKNINTICWVASALSLVAGLGGLDILKPDCINTIAFGGEVMPIKHFNEWKKALPHTRFVQLYGVTECTGMSAYHEADRLYEPHEKIPIGRAFPNTNIFLDENNEICIRGSGICLGYYKDPERTSKAFIQNPNSDFYDLIYKTGDIASINSNGEFEFVSRKDFQIKHMGYRIELTEIEAVAIGLLGVRQAAVIYSDEKIYLYYSGEPVEPILQYLKKYLPRYAVPQKIIQLDNLPQTTGGKIDRSKLKML